MKKTKGGADSLSIEKFNPTVADIRALVSSSESLVVSDFGDKEQLAAVKTKRIEIRDARLLIQNTGKTLRADALRFQREVIAREKELVDMLTPEEDRLKGIEQTAKDIVERERRLALLPERKEMLSAIGDKVKTTDEYLLEMDDASFTNYVNERREAYNESIRLANEKKQAELKEKEDALKREKELADAQEKARKQERERIEREARERGEREAREKKEAEAKERAEKARLEKEVRYKKWLSDNGCTPAKAKDFKIVKEGDIVVLYKLVSTFNVNG